MKTVELLKTHAHVYIPTKFHLQFQQPPTPSRDSRRNYFSPWWKYQGDVRRKVGIFPSYLLNHTIPGAAGTTETHDWLCLLLVMVVFHQGYSQGLCYVEPVCFFHIFLLYFTILQRVSNWVSILVIMMVPTFKYNPLRPYFFFLQSFRGNSEDSVIAASTLWSKIPVLQQEQKV